VLVLKLTNKKQLSGAFLLSGSTCSDRFVYVIMKGDGCKKLLFSATGDGGFAQFPNAKEFSWTGFLRN
jgi:hypothetical protein